MPNDKIKGCLYGLAIGDALGLGTVFMTRREAQIRYPNGLTSFDQIIKDAHRSQYHPGEYTNCTHFAMLMAESMLEADGLDPDDYAKKLHEWYARSHHLDIEAHLRWILSHPDFLNNPYGISSKIQETLYYGTSSDEALSRALIAGLWPEYDEDKILKISEITNWGSMSDACAAVISSMSHSLITENREKDFSDLKEIARRHDPDLLPYLEIAAEGDLNELNLDDEESFKSAPKTLAAALWALWHHIEPAKALEEVVLHGGDAHTNASLALGLLGLKYGYKGIPEKYSDKIIGGEALDSIADRLSRQFSI